MPIWGWPMIRAVLGAILVSPCFGPALATAQGGVWEIFYQRCLVPMETIQAPDLSGLGEGEKVGSAVLGLMPELQGRQFMLEGLSAHLVVSQDGLTCMVIQTASQAAEGFGEAELWADRMRAVNRYENLAEIEMGQRNFNMGSTEWREPRLNVFGQAGGRRQMTVYYVMETDLEA